MTQAEVIAFCLSLEGAHGRRPYGPQPFVMCVREKTSFCIIREDTEPLHISLKCDPIEAELLRTAYHPAIQPGYHCNKRHWNSVFLDGTVSDDEVRRMLKNAYLLALGRKNEVTPIR